MAYADCNFYKNTYHGDVVPVSAFPRLSERASDFIDMITNNRLEGRLPRDDYAAAKIGKAVCAVAEKMYDLELAEARAREAATSGTTTQVAGGSSSGIVTSLSAGGESISYASPTEMAGSVKEWSSVYFVAGDARETNKLLYNTAKMYLTGVKAADGMPLLFAGVGRGHVLGHNHRF